METAMRNPKEVPAMQFPEIEFLWKDTGSSGGGCPSLSRVDGGYIVNGIPVDEQTRARIPHIAATGEAAVFVPANVLDRLKDLL
jgi:hypothetical protein